MCYTIIMNQEAVEFWKRINALMNEDLNQAWLSRETGINPMTISGWKSKGRIPPADRAVKIAKAFGVSVEYLVTGSEEDEDEIGTTILQNGHYHTPNFQEFVLKNDDKVLIIPISEQRISAGPGQELMDPIDSGMFLPVLKRMVVGCDINSLRVVEARGDSMTGIQLFNGDLVVFAKNESDAADGVFVISVYGQALVKRVEFDIANRQLICISENKKYSPKVYSMDDPEVRVEGKVVGWYHKHPY